jgi:hypothetical protein
MAQNNFGTFEEQLKKDADNLQFKPSAKVWQGVESGLNSSPVASSGGAVSNIAKSLLSNWILNIMVPAVVLVGGGGIFYANYQQNIATETTNNVSSKENSISSNVKTDVKTNDMNHSEKVLQSNPTNNNPIVIDNGITISDNQNNANAVNYSLGYSSTNMNKNHSTANTSSSSVVNNNITDSEHFGNTSSAIFTPSDIEKISKKENEKNSPSDYKERNLKSIDFKD